MKVLNKRDLFRLKMYESALIILNNQVSKKYKKQLEVLKHTAGMLAGSDRVIYELHTQGYFSHGENIYTLLYNEFHDAIHLIPVCFVKSSYNHIQKFNDARDRILKVV